MLKFDVAANRYDLLCLEGVGQALSVYANYPKVKAPVFTTTPATLKMTVKTDHTSKIRPYVVCAVLRDIAFDEVSYQSFLDLQAKLHDNICRDRKLVAIGTHDLDTIEGPFTYDARDPKDIQFVPLVPKGNKTYDAKSLLEFYRDDKATEAAEGQGRTLKPYTDIIFESEVYPVITDAKDRVLSLPPIINGDHSKMSRHTKNVFVECTATDETKANIVLNMMVTMFSRYCAKPFVVEQVDVVYEGTDKRVTTPDLTSRKMRADVSYINALAGTPGLSASTICENLGKMMLVARPVPATSTSDDDAAASKTSSEEQIEIEIPPIRPDILHACDIAEDAAIGFGYNNIKTLLPPTNTVGKQQPINYLTELLRSEVGLAGFQEVLTLGLNSRDENYTHLRIPDDGRAVALSNPVTMEFQICRTTLLTGILKTLQHNIGQFRISEGLRAFEISDVVRRFEDDEMKNDPSGTGTYNRRHMAAVYVGPDAGFEIVHGLIDHFMSVVGIAPVKEYAATDTTKKCLTADQTELCAEYFFKPSSCPTYFDKYCADIYVRKLSREDGKELKVVKFGTIGVLHPEVLEKFNITYPGTAMEMDVENLLDFY